MLSMVVHENKEQVAWFELAESFILWRNQVFRMRVKNLAVFNHSDLLMEEAQGKFTNNSRNIEATKLETGT